MQPVSLIPFACGAGGSTPGAELGPVYCHEQKLETLLAQSGIAATWKIDPQSHWQGPWGQDFHRTLPPRGDRRRHDCVQWHNRQLAQNVAESLAEGQRAVTIGGDHSMAAGSMVGAQAVIGPDVTLGLVWVDAHTDLHTFASSTSKALHGMPVGSLLGLDDALALPLGCYPVFAPENVVYAGLRDVDPGEVEHAQTIGLSIPSMDDLRRDGIAAILQPRLEDLMSRCDHIFLSIDLDAFAAPLAPAVGTLVPGGFQPEEILPLLRDMIERHSVPLIEVVELNPTLPGVETTYRLLADILSELLRVDI